jgi:glutamate---cysteine ligase / carboxylate-amine ligase
MWHCLAVHEATVPRERGLSREVLRELGFRAARDGLDACLLHDGRLHSARAIGYRAVTIAGAYAAELGWHELMLLHRLLQRGNGADRQRRHEQDGGLGMVLRRLADETARGCVPAAPSSEPDPREHAVEIAA